MFRRRRLVMWLSRVQQVQRISWQLGLSSVANSHYGAAQGGSRRSRFQKLAPEAVRRVEYVTARQAITEVTLELCARYGAWFRCAGDLRCGGGWRRLDPVGEFSKPMAPGPRSSIPCRRRFDG
jgi:hypothetical protein